MTVFYTLLHVMYMRTAGRVFNIDWHQLHHGLRAYIH